MVVVIQPDTEYGLLQHLRFNPFKENPFEKKRNLSIMRCNEKKRKDSIR